MAYNWFSSSEKGLTSIQAAAVVGNLMRESGLNPTILNTSGSGAYGIGQWLGDRLTTMKKWTADHGLDPNSVNGQLQFVYYESTQRDSRSYPGTKEWDGLKKQAALEDAVKYWEHNFERADDPPDGVAKRVSFANDTLTKYGSGGASGGGVSQAACSATSQSTATTFNYEDTARGRKFKTTVYTPNGTGPWPVVMFAHGYQKGPDAYTRYIQAIANKGYVVVAPSFPNADEHGILPLDRNLSLPQQPADIKFVLDQILKEPGLQGKIKPDSIAMVGHSDGAIDALMVGYSAQKDARFKVVVSVGADDYSSQLDSGPPLLQMHGEKDTIAKHDGDLNNFHKITANPKHFFTMLGGDHGVPSSWVDTGGDDTPALDALTTGFLDMELNGKPDTLKAIGDQFSGKVKEEQ
jgi:dienelactone hydrolase